MSFVDRDGSQQRPVMVHRALHGALERFLGVLIEHYGGAFPMWLAPVQAVVIPVNPQVNEYAEAVAKRLQQHDFRVDADLSDNRLGAKIRTAQKQKVPYMMVVGAKEQAAGTVSLRDRTGRADSGAGARCLRRVAPGARNQAHLIPAIPAAPTPEPVAGASGFGEHSVRQQRHRDLSTPSARSQVMMEA